MIIDYFNNFSQVMAPLAKSLDILQAENKSYFGYLLPVIQALLLKLQKSKESLKYCEPLNVSLTQGVKNRFRHFFIDKNVVTASVLHPKFKLGTWLDPVITDSD